jgi:hypothetical protein
MLEHVGVRILQREVQILILFNGTGFHPDELGVYAGMCTGCGARILN